MKKTISILLLTLSLAGCATFGTKPDAPVAVQYKYIITRIPPELLQIPPPVPKIDTKTATDADAAQWLIDSEVRAQNLENKLKALKAYLDKKLKDLNLPPESIVQN